MPEKWKNLTVNQPDQPEWIKKTHKFWYRKSTAAGYEFVLVDADAATKTAAFDHEKLAGALTGALKDRIDPKIFAFTRIEYVDQMKAIEFRRSPDGSWIWRGDRRQNQPGSLRWATKATGRMSADGQSRRLGKAEGVSRREMEGSSGNQRLPPSGGRATTRAVRRLPASPSVSTGWRRLLQLPIDHLVARFKEHRRFRRRGASWQIDFMNLPGRGQLQPKTLFAQVHQAGRRRSIFLRGAPSMWTSEEAVDIDNALFANPYDLSESVMEEDGRAFTFEYNQRATSLRIIEWTRTSRARAVISEEPRTFFPTEISSYGKNSGTTPPTAGNHLDVQRDGWNHLYLFDERPAKSGKSTRRRINGSPRRASRRWIDRRFGSRPAE